MSRHLYCFIPFKKEIGFIRKLIHKFIAFFFLATLRLRYKIKVVGFENIDPRHREKPGGYLILPNHTAYVVDPLLVDCIVFKKMPLYPLVFDFIYHIPGLQPLLSFLEIIPIPGFEKSINSFKVNKLKRTLDDVTKRLDNGDNLLLYPSGMTKKTPKEIIGSTSSLYYLLNNTNNVNIILVRTTGLWGSSFSWANPNSPPYMGATSLKGIKHTLKNLIFFNPRREVTIEFEKPPKDFPLHGTKKELNCWLENWYNREGPFYDPVFSQSEPLYLVPYSIWTKKAPQINVSGAENLKVVENTTLDDTSIPLEIKEKVLKELSNLTQLPQDQLNQNLNLSRDLDLDSISVAQLLIFLENEFDQFDISGDQPVTIGDLIKIAAGQLDPAHIQPLELSLQANHYLPALPNSSKSAFELFLKNTKEYSKQKICADDVVGSLSFGKIGHDALLIAELLLSMPEQKIGVLLPVSATLMSVLVAFQIAKKTPVLLDMRAGPIFFNQIVEEGRLEKYLSSFYYLDSVNNVDFGKLDSSIVLLDDLLGELPFKNKIKCRYYSLLTPQKIAQKYCKKNVPSSTAVFSYFEKKSLKLISVSYTDLYQAFNQLQSNISLKKDDVILFIGPSNFQAMGTMSLAPLLVGIPIYYYLLGTNPESMIHRIKELHVTVLCASSEVIHQINQIAPDTVKSLRLKIKMEQLNG